MRLGLALLIVATALTVGAPRVGAQARGQGGGGGATMRTFLGLGPAPDEAAAKKGEPLYQQQCAGCHGPGARGGQAPSLLRSPLVLHDVKGEALAPVIKSGRPGMPGFPDLTADEVYNLAQYIHLQVELTSNRGTYDATYASLKNQPTGDPRLGEAFFTGAGGCTRCHSATGDLAKVGGKYPQVATLKARFLWPSTSAPAKAIVRTRAGEAVAGTVKSITDFDISLIDANGTYRYFRRTEVTVAIEDKLAGHRALLPKYSDADISNLAAYLVTLK